MCITLIRYELWPMIFGPDTQMHDSTLQITFEQKKNLNKKKRT